MEICVVCIGEKVGVDEVVVWVGAFDVVNGEGEDAVVGPRAWFHRGGAGDVNGGGVVGAEGRALEVEVVG